MSIAQKLFLLIATSMTALLLLAGLNYFQMEKVYSVTSYTSTYLVPKIHLLDDVTFELGRIRVRVHKHVLAPEKSEMAEIADKIKEAHASVEKSLKAYEERATDAEDKRLLAADRSDLAEYFKEADEIIDLSAKGKKDEALALINKYAPRTVQLNKTFVAHMDYIEAQGKTATEQGAAAKSRANWIGLVIAVFALAMLSFIGTLIVRSLISRVSQANSVAERIAAGNLRGDDRFQPTQDEIGRLIQSLEKMRANLAATISDIIAEAGSLNESSTQLSGAAQYVAMSSENQLRATASAKASVELLTDSIVVVSRSTEEARLRTSEAESLALSSASEVDHASGQVLNVAERVEQSAQQIQSLSAQVQKISNVTLVIRELADQTNLLALNAAIEAARAGEQGRGFAVVADEVRKLAERTTQSVQEIAGMVAAIQGEAASAVDLMQNSRQVVSEVVASAQRASDAMKNIRSSAATMQSTIVGISDVLKQQNAASDNLLTNVADINEKSAQNADAVTSVSSTASALAEVAGKLKRSVARFAV